MNKFEVGSLPVYVGYYAIGGNTGIRLNMKKRPKWLHRKMMSIFFGWEWVDHDVIRITAE